LRLSSVFDFGGIESLMWTMTDADVVATLLMPLLLS